jgi:hypothetical protein
MADREKDEKEKMKRGLLAKAQEFMENNPPLRRLSAIMRALRGEMQRCAATGGTLAPVGAFTDETEKVAFLDGGGTREQLLARLQEMAFSGRITTGGVCTPARDNILEIHGEDRNLPKWAILCFEPLHPPADQTQPLRGRRKKTPQVIFASGDPSKMN